MVPAAVESFIQARREPPPDPAPRRAWVYRQVLDAIRSGALPAGARLPSARRLALAWAVPRGAIDEAYAQLQAEGLVERHVGSGSFIAAHLRRATTAPPPLPLAVDATTRAAVARLTAWTDEALAFTTGDQRPKRLEPGAPETAGFPIEHWRRELAQALADDQRAALSYGVPAGVAALREATARHLSLTRGIECRSEQVLIIGSPRQGIELITRVLLAPGQCVCVEDPGPLSMTRRFGLSHLDVVGVAPDDEGFDVASARRLAPHAAAVVLQPLHQWPTGVRTSLARRSELQAWCDAGGTWLVELDSLGEIVHDGAAPPTLFSSDKAGRVIFLGSFGALTFPALRLAYLVLPEALVDVFAAMRGLMGEHSAVALQMALAGFIDGGHLAAHVRTMRRLYRARRDILVRAVRVQLPPSARLGPLSGGTHACLHVDAAIRDTVLAERLNQRGLGVQALSRHTWQHGRLNGLLLGYGADDEAAIALGIGEVAAALRAP